MAVRTFFFIDSETMDTSPADVEINEPRMCMHCHNTGMQVFITGIITEGKTDAGDGLAVYTCHLCTSSTIHFLKNWIGSGTYFDSFKTLPTHMESAANLSSKIKNEFPDFPKIYNQAKKAENSELDLIAGMGYRKALEFLVTDYLMKYHLDKVSEEDLNNPKTSLRKNIDKLPGEKIKQLAKAASFIGNDETHYTRRHPEYDIEAIKAFISAVIAEIENEIIFEEAQNILNKGN